VAVGCADGLVEAGPVVPGGEGTVGWARFAAARVGVGEGRAATVGVETASCPWSERAGPGVVRRLFGKGSARTGEGAAVAGTVTVMMPRITASMVRLGVGWAMGVAAPAWAFRC
jgi:hypothetical protein